ncbi:MFS transporter [Micromonospora sp. D93]|uniref:MFS transporter n=1 Tax=Micromonospora sp. D93 TaxID=2824886 RepID=UPI001B38EC23|nr:MFS transporter [Micromonospora sp. D93]MBQ1017619.1 MFS transporter [Micromonospora sp. D93]
MVAVAALAFVITLFSSAMKNTITAFFVPMAVDFEVSRGIFAVAPSLFMFTYAVASMVSGYLADLLGAKRVMIGGLVLSALVFLVGGLTESFTLFAALYGVGMAFASATVSYVPLGVLVDELFPPHRRGLAYAAITNGTAVGFIVLLPLWIQLSDRWSWRSVFVALSLVMLALAAAAVAGIPQRVSEPAQAASDDEAVAGRWNGFARVRRSRTFWAVSTAFVGCGVTMAFVDVHLVASLSEHHLGHGVESLTSVVLGAAELVGAIVAGYLCDRGHPLAVLAGGYLLRALGMIVLAVHPTAFGAAMFGLLFGVSYLATVVAGTMLLLAEFDARSRGLALGLMWLMHQVGAFLASQAGGLSFDRYGSYGPITVAGAAAAIGSLLIIVLTRPGDRAKSPVLPT